MKLPTSSSLLIASLAVSLSSSSSLSALAAPTGDLPEGSSPSKPGPVAPCSSDGAPEARSFGNRLQLPFSDGVPIIGSRGDSESGAAGNSTSPDPNTAPAPAAAAPSAPVQPPVQPPAVHPPVKPPVEPPVNPTSK